MSDATAVAGTFFQFGYITSDIERAMDLIRQRYKVREFLTFEMGGVPYDRRSTGAQFACAWRGDVMIELIRPDQIEPGLYGEGLRADGGIALHHFGNIVADLDEFTALPGKLRERGIPIAMERTSPTGVSVVFADTRADLGHFTEFVQPGVDKPNLLDKVPRN